MRGSAGRAGRSVMAASLPGLPLPAARKIWAGQQKPCRISGLENPSSAGSQTYPQISWINPYVFNERNAFSGQRCPVYEQPHPGLAE